VFDGLFSERGGVLNEEREGGILLVESVSEDDDSGRYEGLVTRVTQHEPPASSPALPLVMAVEALLIMLLSKCSGLW
jgi:hypothetical protein